MYEYRNTICFLQSAVLLRAVMLTFLKYVDSQLFKQLITKIIIFKNVKNFILLVITLLIFWFLIGLFAILNPIGGVILGLYKRERCICHFF